VVSPALKARMTEVARGFRKAPTPQRGDPLAGVAGRGAGRRKFRRQQPIGPFIVDFYCSTERLIVEVDGGVHETQRERDSERQALLESLDLRFVRLPAVIVETNLPAALRAIGRAFTSSSPLPHPAPLVGEGPGEGGTEAA
jgi:very-short-patch-repair endonuclease